MSDPVSNAEIEDVLSSIRRLVSTDDRGNESPDDEGEPDDAPDAAAPLSAVADDRLVLTPSLRVDDDAGSAAGDDPSEHDGAGADQPIEFRHTDPDGADKPRQTGAREDEQGDAPVRDDRNEPYVLDAAQSATRPAEAPELPSGPSTAAPLEDRIAEVEAAVAARDDEWEPDGDWGDDYSGSAMSAIAWTDYEPEPRYDDDEHAEDGPAETEAEHQHPEQPDHAAATADPSAERYHERPGEGAAQPTGPEADTSGWNDEAPLWSDDSADAVLDEDALRDMVSEIVRQELQGALGERITRNVRKLVRREIHRALNSHDLD